MTPPAKPTFCPHCHSNKIIRKGTRKNQFRLVPLYFCKDCYKYFSSVDIAKVKYLPHVILRALSLYDLGYPQTTVAKMLTARYRVQVPQRTVSSWLARYEKLCTFRSLRPKAVKLYSPEDMVSTQTLEHRQVYEFKLHLAKLELLGNVLGKP